MNNYTWEPGFVKSHGRVVPETLWAAMMLGQNDSQNGDSADNGPSPQSPEVALSPPAEGIRLERNRVNSEGEPQDG